MQIKNYIYSNFLLRNINNLRYSQLEMIYKMDDLTPKYYQQIQNLDQELEHQIGRLTNYYSILKIIDNKKMEGDVIEFGTWKGFSLLWIAYLSERLAIYDKKIVGIDCFEGLPKSDGVFAVGSFNNTSLSECRNNIYRSKDLYQLTKNNIYIEKYNFEDTNNVLKMLKMRNIEKLSLIHIDCDIASSFTEIMKILLKGNLLANNFFILFDDYGCDSSLAKYVNKMVKEMSTKWNIKVHSKTRFTKNFEFKKKKSYRYGQTKKI